MSLASTQDRDARVAICLACSSLRRGMIFTCKLCGCPIRTKTALASNECPAGKWSKIDPSK